MAKRSPLAEKLEQVRERIAAAAAKAGTPGVTSHGMPSASRRIADGDLTT